MKFGDTHSICTHLLCSHSPNDVPTSPPPPPPRTSAERIHSRGAGPRSAIGRAPTRLVSRGSWVRNPAWQHTFVSPSAFSRRAVVSYWRKYVHEVLVNRLGGLSLPRKSVVRLTDRPDMTFDVYRGRKTTNQQINNHSRGTERRASVQYLHTRYFISVYSTVMIPSIGTAKS